MNYENYEFAPVTLREHTLKTFLWMFVGLLVTTAVSFVSIQTGLLLHLLIKIPYLAFVFLIAQIAVVLLFNRQLKKLNPTMTLLIYIIYSVIMGISISSIAYVYDLRSIFMAFLICVVYFGLLVFIGYTTKFNLMKLGPILFVGLLALVIVEIAMLIFKMPIDTMIISAISLVLFTGITAYDTQKMKLLYAENVDNQQALKTLAIYSAFQLYLDFINLFLDILRLISKRR